MTTNTATKTAIAVDAAEAAATWTTYREAEASELLASETLESVQAAEASLDSMLGTKTPPTLKTLIEAGPRVRLAQGAAAYAADQVTRARAALVNVDVRLATILAQTVETAWPWLAEIIVTTDPRLVTPSALPALVICQARPSGADLDVGTLTTAPSGGNWQATRSDAVIHRAEWPEESRHEPNGSPLTVRLHRGPGYATLTAKALSDAVRAAGGELLEAESAELSLGLAEATSVVQADGTYVDTLVVGLAYWPLVPTIQDGNVGLAAKFWGTRAVELAGRSTGDRAATVGVKVVNVDVAVADGVRTVTVFADLSVIANAPTSEIRELLAARAAEAKARPVQGLGRATAITMTDQPAGNRGVVVAIKATFVSSPPS